MKAFFLLSCLQPGRALGAVCRAAGCTPATTCTIRNPDTRPVGEHCNTTSFLLQFSVGPIEVRTHFVMMH